MKADGLKTEDDIIYTCENKKSKAKRLAKRYICRGSNGKEHNISYVRGFFRKDGESDGAITNNLITWSTNGEWERWSKIGE